MCLLHNHVVLTSSHPCVNRHLHDFSLCHEEDESCALLGYYTAGSGNFLLTFWDYVSVPSSRFKVLGPCVSRRAQFSKQTLVRGYKRGHQ